MDSKGFNLSWDVLWKILFVFFIGWLLFVARDVVAAILLAIVVSTAFGPFVDFLQKNKIPRILGTLLIYLFAIFVFGFLIYAFIPVILTELTNLITFATEVLGQDSGILNIKNIIDSLTFDLNKTAELLFSGNVSLLGVASKFLGGILYVIAIFAISFYLNVGRDGVKKFIVALLPDEYEDKFINIYTRTSKKIGAWFRGQLFLSLVVGVVTFFGLWFLGVKYSLLFGLLAGIFEIVPFVGPILTGMIAVMVAFGESTSLAFYVLILFVVIQQLENNTLVPVVMKYTTSLDPVVILSAVMIGGTAFGITGLVLAVPVAVFLEEGFEYLADKKKQSRKNQSA